MTDDGRQYARSHSDDEVVDQQQFAALVAAVRDALLQAASF